MIQVETSRSNGTSLIYSWCLKLAGLPNRDNQHLQNIHLMCSSNKVQLITQINLGTANVRLMHICICTCIIMNFVQVNCIDMTPPIVEELKSVEEEGVMTFDALLRKMMLV